MLTDRELLDKLHMGIVVLRVDYFKTTGKWYAGGWVELGLSVAQAKQYNASELLELIDGAQNELRHGAYREFIVVIGEEHYDSCAEYHEFFTRLYMPNRSGE